MRKNKIASILAGSLFVFFGLNACSAQESSNQASGNDQGTVVGGQQTALTLSIGVIESDLRNGQIVVVSTLKNNGRSKVNLLTQNTPFDSSLTAPVFSVTDLKSGRALDYIGIVAKRAAPTADDYVLLKEGQKIRKQQVLSGSYQFCSNAEYKVDVQSALFDDQIKALLVESSPVTFITPEKFNDC